MRIQHALSLCLFVFAAACTGSHEYRASLASTSAPAPLEYGGSAYHAAAAVSLPEADPEEFPGLHQVYRLSEQIISGAEPQGSAGLEQLRALGVRTIISVDGKLPNSASAAQLGMRYVHIPIHYRGMTGDELTRLAKTFRELESPFYVHCFHGKHRGPAAAAIGRVVLDGASREQAIAEMRQWCATSEKYEGLYRSVASSPLPSRELTADYEFDFAAAHRFDGLRGGMIGVARKWDLVKAAKQRDWRADPAHPDVEPAQEIAQLGEIYAGLCELEDSASKAEDFRDWMEQGRDASERLLRALGERQAADGVWRAEAREAYEQIADSCASCHAAYRNE